MNLGSMSPPSRYVHLFVSCLTVVVVALKLLFAGEWVGQHSLWASKVEHAVFTSRLKVTAHVRQNRQ